MLIALANTIGPHADATAPLVVAWPSVALAHGSGGMLGWNLDPLIVGSLSLLAALYAVGLLRLWQSAGAGRGLRRGQAGAFAGAIAVLVVALLSPLDPLSDALGSAHMVQHMLLMMVAAPLFVMGAPMLVMLWALPRAGRQRVARALARLERWRPPWYLLWQPVLLFTLFALTLWAWHLPALYQAALRGRWVHEGQHLMFFATSCLFWRVLLDPLSRLRMSVGAGVVYLFLTSLHATLLGVFMALSPRVWYADYVPRTGAWGLSPLEDQQVAGLIMWMPACAIYALVAAVMLVWWLRQAEADEPATTTILAAAAAEGGR